MDRLVLTILITTIFIVFSFYFYYRSGSNNKKIFREAVTANVFTVTFIAPLVGAALFSVIISIVFKESNRETFFRSDVVLLTLMFYLYGIYSVSQGMHALAKTFKPDVVRVMDKKLVSLLYFFHGPFSHYGSNFSLISIFCLFLIYNVNHPARHIINGFNLAVVIICGLVLGLAIAAEAAISNMVKILRWFFLVLFILLSLYERNSKATLLHSPLSILVLTSFGTATVILFLDRLGPKKYWFYRKIDQVFGSVNKDWSKVFISLSRKLT